MKRVRPVFISHNPYRSPEAKLRNQKRHNRGSDTAERQSEPQILVGLGLIATLLSLGGIQLFRSVNAKSIQTETSPTQTSTVDLNSPSIAPSVELNSFTNPQKAEMLTIQNAVSNGKF